MRAQMLPHDSKPGEVNDFDTWRESEVGVGDADDDDDVNAGNSSDSIAGAAIGLFFHGPAGAAGGGDAAGPILIHELLLQADAKIRSSQSPTWHRRPQRCWSHRRNFVQTASHCTISCEHGTVIDATAAPQAHVFEIGT